jgi:hypothetical protein
MSLWKKIALNVAQHTVLSNLILDFFPVNSPVSSQWVAQKYGPLLLFSQNFPNYENIHPRGENWPNLVALLSQTTNEAVDLRVLRKQCYKQKLFSSMYIQWRDSYYILKNTFAENFCKKCRFWLKRKLNDAKIWS